MSAEHNELPVSNHEEPARPRVVASSREAPGNVDQIRDILFGSQMRQYEARFARLEDLMMQETGQLRSDMNKRLDTLEVYVKQELNALGDQMRSERGERTDSVRHLTGELKSMGETLHESIRNLGDKNAEAERQLRQQLLDQSKELLEAIQSRHESLSSAMERQLADLRGGKVDRAGMADLLTEVALRLRDEFHLPETDR